jgi:hydroxymethylpyrimidine pyrophosphatase-like HAD family hydrolase
MGKPFNSELENLQKSLLWAKNCNLDNYHFFFDFLKYPNIVVGSGGSMSVCALVSLLHSQSGLLSVFSSPLDFNYLKHAVDTNTNVIFITASGNNTDILFGYKNAIELHPKGIYNFILSKDSKLLKHAEKYSVSKSFQFEPPIQKDGFLATNSLIVFFTLFSRIYNVDVKIDNVIPEQKFLKEIKTFVEKLENDFTLIVLYSGWSKPVAIDIESKFSEAGLGNILITDYRNFGHGRHNWLDKKKTQTAIVSLVTNEDLDLITKTLSLIPENIPILKINSEYFNANGSIDLLAKSFYLVNEIGIIKDIDPGRPGVPSYGRKLYNLNYQSIYKTKDKTINDRIKIAIEKKYKNINGITNKKLLNFLVNESSLALEKLRKTKFGGFVFDYDDTLIAKENRYNFPDEKIIKILITLLENDIKIAIMTGRGKSIREKLIQKIPSSLQSKLIVGYYNGGIIIPLSEELKLNENPHELLSKISQRLNSYNEISDLFEVALRDTQLTITVEKIPESTIIKSILKDIIRELTDDVEILESSHSIDIIPKGITKTLIFKYFDNDIKLLCVGDMGKFGGNDYRLLSSEFSLGVNEVSQHPERCWNFAPSGVICDKATLYYLNKVKILEKGVFKINL